jgi:hypothetical protein
MRLVFGLGLASLVAALALQTSASARPWQDPPPLPVPGPSFAAGKGATAFHRFEFEARTEGRFGPVARGSASFLPRTRRVFRWAIQVTCFRASENRAVVGGAATRAGRPAGGVLFYVEDNGRGNDRISRLQGFKTAPRQCPEPVMPARIAQQAQGEIFVRATNRG